MPGVLKVWDGTKWVPHVGAPAGRTGPLAVRSYWPAAITTVAAPTANTDLADVDATNLAVTFTVPPSGQVLLVLNAVAFGVAGSSAYFWGVREGAAVVYPKSEIGAVAEFRGSMECLITGLTPGETKTYKWAHAQSNTAAAAKMEYGGDRGPAVMEVWDAVGTQPDGGRVLDRAKARRTAGNLTLNSTAWADVDTAMDLTLTGVRAGDEIAYGVSGLWGPENVYATLDVVTMVGATPTNSFAVRGAVAAPSAGRISGWYGINALGPISGEAPPYTVVAGDLTDGAVTLRLRYATVTAANKTLYASAEYPFDVWAENKGGA